MFHCSQLFPLYLESNSALFSWEKTSHYKFNIRTRNEIGYSANVSSIELFPFTNPSSMKLHTPQSIQNVYHGTNRTYTLTWEAPVIKRGLLSFTVYWCYSKRALQNECKVCWSLLKLNKYTGYCIFPFKSNFLSKDI